MLKLVISSFLLIAIVGCGSTSVKTEGNSSASVQNPTSVALRKSQPIKIYMGACVVSRANPSGVKSQAKDLNFTPLYNEAAQKYLKGKRGNAWRLKNVEGEFGLVSLQNSLCSVFIHQGNPKTIQASMEAWLPPKNSGFTVKKELVSKSGYLSTTAYKIYLKARFYEQWVITTNSQPNADLVAIMTYDAP